MNIIDTMVKTGHLTQEQADSTKRAVEEVLQAAREDWQFAEQLEKAAAMNPASAAANVTSGIVNKPGFSPSLMWQNMKANASGVMESDLPKYVLLSAAAEGIGAVAGGVGNLYDAVKAKFEAHQNYETMLEKNPSLRNHPDQEMVRTSFNTLQKLNPAYASDPLVAGSFVSTTLRMEGVDLNSINSLTGAYKNYHDARKGGPASDRYRQMAELHQDPNEQAFTEWERGSKQQIHPVKMDEAQSKADSAFSHQQEAGTRAEQAVIDRETAEHNRVIAEYERALTRSRAGGYSPHGR